MIVLSDENYQLEHNQSFKNVNVYAPSDLNWKLHQLFFIGCLFFGITMSYSTLKLVNSIPPQQNKLRISHNLKYKNFIFSLTLISGLFLTAIIASEMYIGQFSHSWTCFAVIEWIFVLSNLLSNYESVTALKNEFIEIDIKVNS